jgi:hypothetical protein
MIATAPAPTRRRPQAGPPLWIPVAAFAALTLAYVIVNRSTPHPDASGLDVLRYAAAHSGAEKVGAFLILASSMPLAIVAAVVYRRLRALGITAPGSAIALVGGILAAAALALSALFAWAEARLGGDASPALARALADLSFLSGGSLYAATFGLLIAGVAVPGLLARLVPPALAWTGLALGVAGEVATLGLLADGLSYLLPVVRFGGLLWLLIAAVRLPSHRRAA